LSYQPWNAIAEFVDNSTQNFYDHKSELSSAYKKEGRRKFIIQINYDSENNKLEILDNANGMDFAELERAVILNRPPADTSGRCEFGMGLKTAACWFGRKWTITTKRLGAEAKYSITVDVEEMSRQSNEILSVQSSKTNLSEHFTKITIEGLYKPIQGRTASRIKEQLSSIYRRDLAMGQIEIWWNATKLSFPDPPILEEIHPDKNITTWKKLIAFKVPWESEHQVLSVRGWIALRMPGSQKDAGFVLLRRERVIIGGPDSGYKPEEIFGQGNTFRSQRLIGELELDDWPVTQAKDAFDWSGGLEDKFIEILKEKSKDYMEKAEGLRVDRKPTTKQDMAEASTATKKIFEDESFSNAISAELAVPLLPISSVQQEEDLKKIKAVSDGPIIFTLQLHNTKWIFKIYWQGLLSDAHWMSVEYPSDTEIDVYLNSNHPFFDAYLSNLKMLELLQKFVLALALAEKLARLYSKDNKIDAADFRTHMNRVLRHASEIKGGQQ